MNLVRRDMEDLHMAGGVSDINVIPMAMSLVNRIG